MDYNNLNNGNNNENGTNVETFDLDRFTTEQNNNVVNTVPAVDTSNDVETIIVKRKTNGKGIIIGIVVFLLICLSGVIGWFAGSYFAAEEEKVIDNNSKVEGKEEESKLPKNEKYTFYKEKTINLHNDENEFNIVVFYYVDKEKLYDGNNEDKKELEYNVLRRDVYVNKQKIGNTELINIYEDSNETENYILNDNLSKLKVLKDTNNKDEYLVFTLGDNFPMLDNGVVNTYPSYRSFAYIINKEGKVLKTITVNQPGYGLQGIEVSKDKIGDRFFTESINDGAVYEDTPEYGKTIYLIYPDDNVLDIHDNFMYYIDGGCDGYKEYKLVITNGVLKEDKIADYSEDIILGAGAC